MQTIFITGASGYIGTRFMQNIDKSLFRIIALVRNGSEHKVPPGIEILIADVFNPESWKEHIPKDCIFIHLLGVAHPSPQKKAAFLNIDRRALKDVANVANERNSKAFIYLSVAMEPSSIMKDFQEAKSLGEKYLESLHLNSIFVRPWYIIGPGHWWPIFFIPLFKLLEIIPATSMKARKFSLITIHQMISSLIYIINHIDKVPKYVEIENLKTLNPNSK
ncbi:MAG: NAD(P)H-binding protein [Saprospiraceae bacterium]|nr:NAD(P)H-binding protein [Saprospiraceae bacterium]